MKNTMPVVRASLFAIALISTTAYAAVETSTTSTGRIARRLIEDRPTNALQLMMSGGAIGPEIGGSRAGNVANTSAFTFNYQWQPAALQSFGVVSFGPTLGVYPAVKTRGQSVDGLRSIWGMGAQAGWQARFSSRQWLVPVASYAAEYDFFSITSGGSGRLWSHGPKLGAWLLLNSLSSDQGQGFAAEYGIERVYAMLEYAHLTGSSSGKAIELKGNSVQFGLRFEY